VYIVSAKKIHARRPNALCHFIKVYLCFCIFILIIKWADVKNNRAEYDSNIGKKGAGNPAP